MANEHDLIRRGDALRLMPADTTQQEALRQSIASLPSVTPGVKAEARADVAGMVEAAKAVLHDIDDLVASSEGVAGLHMNGQVADWESLLDGGEFGAWLSSPEVLRAALAAWEGRE
jgi:hypothetical protein